MLLTQVIINIVSSLQLFAFDASQPPYYLSWRAAIGQCSCFGDPHCISFDGKWNHYQGLCSYVMVQSGCGIVNSKLPEFKVTTHNWDQGYEGHGKYAWIKEVTIEVYNQVGRGCFWRSTTIIMVMITYIY